MVETDRKLNLAIIGVGGWGKNHARVLYDLGVLKNFVVDVDMDMHHAKEIADRYNAKLYPSVEEMM